MGSHGRCFNQHVFLGFLFVEKKYISQLLEIRYSDPVTFQFKTSCFELVMWDEAVVRSPVWKDFRPVFGIGAYPAYLGIWAATDL